MGKSEYITCKISIDNDKSSLCNDDNMGVNVGTSSSDSYGFGLNWSLLRNFFQDPLKGLAMTIDETTTSYSSSLDGFATHLARSTYYNSSLIRLQSTTVNLRVGRGDTDAINDILKHVQLVADIGKNILRLQKRAKFLADESWNRYEQILHNAEESDPLLMSSHYKSKRYTLVEQIFREFTTVNADLEREHIKGEIREAEFPELCQSCIILKWIEQQRQNMLNLSQEIEHKTPVLLDLSYHGRGASEDQPIVLLDRCIDVNKRGIFLHEHQAEEARQAGAHVMVSAIRTAAALELPVNITAIMPLTPTEPPFVLPRMTGSSDFRLIINLKYEPYSICDLESFGTQANIVLIFNVQFPIWRHFHLNRNEVNGTLEPIWMLVPTESNCSFESLTPVESVVHADCSDDSMQDLINLSGHNIVPHMLWRHRENRPFRTTVRFFREVETKRSFSCSPLRECSL